MIPEDLRKRAKRARDLLTREKLELFEAVLTTYRGAAEDKISQRITIAHEELEKRALRAADQGRDAAVLLRLSSQLYDLRQAALEEFSQSAARSPDPYPQLRKVGPYTFRDFDKWLRVDQGWAECDKTSPLPWLDDLARWLLKRDKSGKLGRLLQGGPPMPKHLSALFEECKKRGLKPEFEFYHQLDDRGIALRVSWV
jgi:hypothetical protein